MKLWKFFMVEKLRSYIIDRQNKQAKWQNYFLVSSYRLEIEKLTLCGTPGCRGGGRRGGGGGGQV